MREDTLTPELLRTYRRRVVTPVIVKAKAGMFNRVRDGLKELVPVDLLSFKYQTFLPRVRCLIEFPLSKWKELPAFNMIATVLTPELIEETAQWREVQRIYPDSLKWALQTVPQEGIYRDMKGNVFTSTYWTKRLIGLDRANQQGYTGRDVTTAVIDTGVRISHPQLHGVRALTAMPEKGGGGEDNNGHGTHCVSTVGGAYAIDRRYNNVPIEGMAPDTSLVSIQALGFIIGQGMSSDILQAMEMALRLNAKVVSMSLGGEEAPSDADNPEAEAINTLVGNGVIPVVASGNAGPDPSTIGSPGCCMNSLTVGSVSPFTGALSDFSSRGPTAGDGYVKPDVVAPGERVNSALVGFLDAMVDKTQPKYGPLSGSSMATPHVSGLVACMAQLYAKMGKDLTVDEVKRMMTSLGHEKSNDDGWGLIHWGLVERWVQTEYARWLTPQIPGI